MGTIHICDGPLSASIEPELGAGLSELTMDHGRRPCHILRLAMKAQNFTDLSMYLMVPWTNRIAGAAFDSAGKRHQLRPDWQDGSAIHGDVKTRTWSILDRTPLSARLGFDSREIADSNWPWPYAAQVRYEIDGATFKTELSVRNLGETPMPAGLGFHPFFMRSLHRDDQVEVKVVTHGRYVVEDMIPNAPAQPDKVTARLSTSRPLDDLALDDIFAGFDGEAVITWPQSRIEATVECSPNLGHAVVFSPCASAGGMEPWFCVEPVTMVTDGFNLMNRGQQGTGVVMVGPGEQLTASMTIRLRILERS